MMVVDSFQQTYLDQITSRTKTNQTQVLSLEWCTSWPALDLLLTGQKLLLAVFTEGRFHTESPGSSDPLQTLS